MAAKIGSLFRWRYDALGIAAGLAGICYAHTEDGLACILFQNGVPAALSPIELNRYSQSLGNDLALAQYRFDGLIQLLDDYDRGLFASAFNDVPPKRIAAA